MVDETKIDGIPVYEIYKNLSLKDMTGEEWKDVEGYEGLYIVSNYGRLKSLGNGNSNNSKERIIYQSEKNNGYLQVNLCKDGNKKYFTVQRLVAIAYIQNHYNKQEVNHISEPLYDEENKDLAKKDNRVVNLEWCDRKYNANYGTAINRSTEKRMKKVICIDSNKIYTSAKEAERQTGIARSSITNCCRGKYKSAGKLHWRYATKE